MNDKDPKFRVGNIVRILKLKKNVIKCYQKLLLVILKWEEIVGTYYEKELQKRNQKEFRVEKVIKRKGNKLYVKWKGYDSSFFEQLDW